MKNKALRITLMTIGIIIFVLVIAFVLFVVTDAFAILMPEPPEPAIKYGEFPFKLTYEVNGEIHVYEDVVICEYDGVDNLGTGGKKRKWSKRLKSGNEHIVLLQDKTNDVPFEIYASIPGLPEYYMGDFKKSKEEYEQGMKDDRYLGYKQKDIEHSIKKEKALEQYGVKVINVECSQPIENSFIE